MSSLKLCPFCGSKPILHVTRYHDELPLVCYVKCENKQCSCEPHTLDYNTEEEAVESWNRRVE